MCVVVCTLCCGVVCSVGGGVVWCCVVLCGVVRLGMRKPLRVCVQNASVCAFKTPLCVPGKRPHVLNMRAFSRNTRRRPDRTHGGVLNAHTEAFSAFSVFLALSLSLFSVCPSFSSPFLSSLLFSSLFLSSLSCLLSLLSQQQ